MKRSARFLASLLACLFLLLPAAGLGEVTITPLDEFGDASYEHYIPEADVSLLLPVNCQVNHMLDNVHQQAIGIGVEGFDKTSFVFFAFENEDLRGKSFADMPQEEISAVLGMITNNPSGVTVLGVAELLPGAFVLRARESTFGMYSEHLLAIRGKWLLNMMAGKYGAAPLDGEEVRIQEEMLANALNPEGIWKHVQTYTLPGTAMTLSAPDSVYLRVLAEDDGFVHISLCPRSPGTQISVVQVYAVRDPAYENQTALSLPEGVKNAALGMPSPGGTFDESTLTAIPNFVGDIPALSYESDDSYSHLMALKDGWALYTSVLPYEEFIHPDWVEELRYAALMQLLNGKTPLPDWLPGTHAAWEGNVLNFPLATRSLTVRVPEGYGVDVYKDNADGRSVYLYALNGSVKYFSVQSVAFPTITAEMTLTQAYSQAELEELCDGVTQSAAGQGYNAASEIAQGPLGLPAVHTTTGEQAYEQYYWMMDSHSVSVSFTSEEGPITPEEAALLKGLLMQ